MIKRWIQNIVLGEKANSNKFIAYLRKKGVRVGEGVRFYSPSHNLIDVSSPCLLSIGDYVRITHGVIILTHDYSWSILKRYSSENILPGAVLGSQRPVEIGSNVFIGMNAIITCGVKIGDNVIIGAGSVVTKDCEPNSVYAGVPAKRIMGIEEFYEKRKNAQFEEAKEIAIRYRNVFGKKPDKSVLSEYFMLFSTLDEAVRIDSYKQQMETVMNYEECVAYMRCHKPMFPSFEAFLEACYNEG